MNFYRNVGLELEFCSSPLFDEYEIKRICQHLDFYKNGEFISDFSKWVAKRDYSCGFEINTPILKSEKDFRNIEKVVNFLKSHIKKNKIQAINNKCSLHVHIDVSDYDMRSFKNISKIVKFLEKPVIYKLIKKHRITSVFCKSIDYISKISSYSNANIDSFRKKSKDSFNRDYGMNVRSYDKYGTIEFRYFHATLKFEEIYFWMEFIQNIIEYANKHTIEYVKSIINKDVKEVLEEAGMSKKFMEYLEKKNVRDVLSEQKLYQ